MKRKQFVILLTLILITVFTVTTSCVKDLKDEGIYQTTNYSGTVISQSLGQALSNIKVSITSSDGVNESYYATTSTSNDGIFILKDINTENFTEEKEYYLLVDGHFANFQTKRIPLKGFGQKDYNFGNIELLKGDSLYYTLPSFSFNGHVYRIAPDPNTSYDEYLSWTQANSYCENLTLYGYDDWRMPTVEELECMYQNRTQIGGFINFHNSTISDGTAYNTRSWYHSSTLGTTSSHIKIRWDGGGRTEDYEDGYSNYSWGGSGYIGNKCHVRPIRIEY